MAVGVRSFWKGHLRLALVTIPIRLVSATSSESGTRLHQVDRNSKQRIRYQKVAAESGQPVDSDDIVKGVEIEPGRYVLLDEDELDALKLQTRHQVELLEFTDPADIEPSFFERPYYVLPDGDVAEEGYVVIRDALRATNKCGIGQLTMRGREHLVCLTPLGNGLLLTTLRYENELRSAESIFSEVDDAAKPKKPLVDMARKLIEERAGPFNPGDYQDNYAAALQELVRAKVEGQGAVEVAGGEPAERGATVIDFMEALKRSVEGADSEQGTPKKAARKSNRSAAASAKREPSKRSKADGKEKATKSRK